MPQDDQKIDPLMLDPAAYGWEMPALSEGWRTNQHRSNRDGGLSGNKYPVQESLHNPMNVLTLPIIEAQSKAAAASRASTGRLDESIQAENILRIALLLLVSFYSCGEGNMPGLYGNRILPKCPQ